MNLLKIVTGLLCSAAITLSACASKPASTKPSEQHKNMNSAIIYFTLSGNTELAAKSISDITGAKMVRLMPEKPYSTADVDWTVKTSRCTVEHLDQSLRPGIKPVDVDFAKVDTVFIGFPIWWHEEPAVIRTFLDKYRNVLKDKILFPFCTSYESPMSEADANLKKGFPEMNWKKGLRLPAKTEQIKKWINQ